MASPCELLIDCCDKALALKVGQLVANEAWRIQDKFSRYQPRSVISQLNAQAGKVCGIDEETFLLLQFSQQCYQLSDGLFDITSGVLRKAWCFDGSDNIPSQSTIDSLLPLIGFSQLKFSENSIKMKPDMEIDLGGLGKEYAVDKALQIASIIAPEVPMLVNFGGDLAVNGPRHNNEPWCIGVEHPSYSDKSSLAVTISHGAIATSGDAQRYLLKDGKRYSHVLNVKTGWPIENSPHSITVAAPKCTQAGLLSTLALLQGDSAESFLNEQGIAHWAIR
ncbi:MAG: FAD:protein FMN transferase [Thalassotalea sp.]|nr:FAD:protein FMN transferase [Thalassotalea sp.]